jgi:hypothetical protein
MSIIYHKHHKVPKHAGGTNDPSNIVKLTVEEHADAHFWLYLEYGRWQDRLAYLTLSKIIKHKDWILFIQSKPKSEKTKQKMRKPKSKLHAKNISKGRKGIIFSQQHKDNIGKVQAGIWEIINPKGEIMKVTNLSKFCRDNNLQKPNMWKVSQGLRKDHKGWKCSLL